MNVHRLQANYKILNHLYSPELKDLQNSQAHQGVSNTVQSGKSLNHQILRKLNFSFRTSYFFTYLPREGVVRVVSEIYFIDKNWI